MKPTPHELSVGFVALSMEDDSLEVDGNPRNIVSGPSLFRHLRPL